jgi:hypothetical protein
MTGLDNRHAPDGVAALAEDFAEAAFPQAGALRRHVPDSTLTFDRAANAVRAEPIGPDDAAPGQIAEQVRLPLALSFPRSGCPLTARLFNAMF